MALHGNVFDSEDLKKALDSGDLTRADLEVCTRRILEMFMKLA